MSQILYWTLPILKIYLLFICITDLTRCTFEGWLEGRLAGTPRAKKKPLLKEFYTTVEGALHPFPLDR